MAFLLTGGTGKTSLRLAGFLQQQNLPFLLASRRGLAAAPPGMPAVKFDWLDKSTWDEPFNYRFATGASIKAVYLMEPQAPEPWKPLIEFIDHARQKYAVERFVLCGGTTTELGKPGMGMVWQHFVDTGVDFCVLRPCWFMENFTDEGPRFTIRDQGKIYTATQDAQIPFISATDISAVAFRALTDPDSHNCAHRVCGPELLTYDQIAEKLSKALGRKIEHVKLTGEQRYEGLTRVGVSDYFARFLTNLEIKAAGGVETGMNDTVEKVTGRAPKGFDQFVQEHQRAWVKE